MSELTDAEWSDVQDDLRSGIDVMQTVYGDEDNKNEIVEETDEYAVFADASGHELNELAARVGVDRSALSHRMHDEARSLVDYNWGVVDPIVVEKL